MGLLTVGTRVSAHVRVTPRSPAPARGTTDRDTTDRGATDMGATDRGATDRGKPCPYVNGLDRECCPRLLCLLIDTIQGGAYDGDMPHLAVDFCFALPIEMDEDVLVIVVV